MSPRSSRRSKLTSSQRQLPTGYAPSSLSEAPDFSLATAPLSATAPYQEIARPYSVWDSETGSDGRQLTAAQKNELLPRAVNDNNLLISVGDGPTTIYLYGKKYYGIALSKTLFSILTHTLKHGGFAGNVVWIAQHVSRYADLANAYYRDETKYDRLLRDTTTNHDLKDTLKYNIDDIGASLNQRLIESIHRLNKSFLSRLNSRLRRHPGGELGEYALDPVFSYCLIIRRQ